MRNRTIIALTLALLLGSLSAAGQTRAQSTGDDHPSNRKTVVALRTNFLMPVYNFGLEVPLGDHFSLGFDYYYPWMKSERNSWCSQLIGGFVEARYWITGERHAWTADSRLKGHAIGLYAGAGYYDLQNFDKGNQGEYIDAGLDYTFALPIAAGRLRLEFNIGLGYLQTVYRPYTMSSDHTELIKDPSIRQKTTTFIGPTRGGISLVVPINVNR
jgi:hypothetical protein